VHDRGEGAPLAPRPPGGRGAKVLEKGARGAPAAAGGGQERVDVFPRARHRPAGSACAMGSSMVLGPTRPTGAGRAAYSQLLMLFTIAVVEMP
jgi:hypothetical protein